jgi:Na+/H+ antiporter NhaD/arsenite permease-like protein
MRLNRFRLQAYHVVFFIFIVSNMGGMITPIADPPLFIGFLKGIPFTWTLNNLFLIWLTGLGLCLLAFAYFDTKNKKYNDLASEIEYTGKVFFQGKRNLFWLGLAVFSVFLDPAIFPNIPSVQYHEKSFSFVRELIQLGAAYVCYQTANRKAIENNNFNFEPIVEVVFLFFGIFLSMMPLVEYLEQMAHQEGMQAELSTGLFFGFTGLFSSVLDNAPTYLSMFTLLMSANGYSVHSVQDVQLFLAGNQSILLAAISVAAVVFGAMTYIGNGPNLMVKSIAEQSGLKMPSFGAYILRFSLPILLPIFAVIYLLFFR